MPLLALLVWLTRRVVWAFRVSFAVVTAYVSGFRDGFQSGLDEPESGD